MMRLTEGRVFITDRRHVNDSLGATSELQRQQCRVVDAFVGPAIRARPALMKLRQITLHRLNVAEELHRNEQEMRSQVANDAAAGLAAVEAPAILLCPGVAAKVSQAQMIRLPEIALLDQFAQVAGGGHETVSERHHVTNAGRFGRHQHFPRLGHVERQRLFAQHMQAARQRRHRQRMVQPVGREDEHCVESLVVEQRISVRVEGRHRPALREGLRAPCIPAAHCHYLRARMRRQGRQEHRVRPPARPDDADPYLACHVACSLLNC